MDSNGATDALVTILKEAIQGVAGTVILPAIGAIIVVMIIWGGLQYIQGNAEGGKKTILAAIIGFVIVLAAGGIIILVIQVLGT